MLKYAVACFLFLSAPTWAQTTPKPPLVSSIATGGTAVTVFGLGTISRWADIINPSSATETLYIDIYHTAVAGSATSIPIQPGGASRISGPIPTVVSAVAATTGHTFVAIAY